MSLSGRLGVGGNWEHQKDRNSGFSPQRQHEIQELDKKAPSRRCTKDQIKMMALVKGRKKGSGLLLRCRERRAGSLLAAMVMGHPSSYKSRESSTFLGELELLMPNSETIGFTRLQLLSASLLHDFLYAFSRLFQICLCHIHVTSRGDSNSQARTTSLVLSS